MDAQAQELWRPLSEVERTPEAVQHQLAVNGTEICFPVSAKAGVGVEEAVVRLLNGTLQRENCLGYQLKPDMESTT